MADFKDYQALEAFFLSALSALYPRREAGQLFSQILLHHLGWSRVDFHLERTQRPTPEFVEVLRETIEALAARRPIQYILGVTHFADLALKVDARVLIPRPETEELVALLLAEQGGEARSVLDIGTGSGAIALAVKSKRPKWEVMAIDIAGDALCCARENAQSHQLSVAFEQFDLRAVSRWASLPTFDVIVSNPPYVQQCEKAQMRANVLDYEPHLALFAPAENPLYFYELIADFALQKLKPGGGLYLEINAHLADATLGVLSHRGFEVELRKDLYDKERFVIAKRPPQSNAPGPI